MNNLPVVNVFEYPYELWDERDQTTEEIIQSGNFSKRIKIRINTRVNNHIEAAKHSLLTTNDDQLVRFIYDYLNSSVSYKKMRKEMPSRTPKSLSSYQREFQSSNFNQVTTDINFFGKKLSEEQFLFHGGLWPRNTSESFITNRPLSTSFCPQMALRNAVWAGKAYDAGEMHLFVLRVVAPQTNVFCFRINGTDKGHEAEVLFASGARLTFRSKTLIKKDGKAFKACRDVAGNVIQKQIPLYLIEVDIS